MRKNIETASNAVGVVLLIVVVLALLVGVPELRQQSGDMVTLESGRTVATEDYTVLFLILGVALIVGFLRGRAFAAIAAIGAVAFVIYALGM